MGETEIIDRSVNCTRSINKMKVWSKSTDEQLFKEKW